MDDPLLAPTIPYCLEQFRWSLERTWPLVLVQVLGIIIAIVYMRRASEPAVCVLIAMVALLDRQMFSPLCWKIANDCAANGSLPNWVIGLWPNLFQAGTLALLLAAALGWRRTQVPSDRSDEAAEADGGDLCDATEQ